jgi:hypothetical protein
MTGVVISATVLSYSTLHHRAIAIGIPVWSAWFYPVLYDAFILGASRTWQNQLLADSTRGLAKKATIGGIIAAVVAFVVEFYPKGVLAVLGALMIPAVMATALVLTSRAAADRKAKTPAEPVQEEPKPRPKPKAPRVPAEPVTAKVEGSTIVPEQAIPMTRLDDGKMTNAAPVTVKVDKAETISKIEFDPVTTEDKRSWVHAQLDAGVEVTGGMINSKYGGRNGARLLKSVLEERTARNGSKVNA